MNEYLCVSKKNVRYRGETFTKNGQIVEDGAEFIINPYDEYAVEEAIQLKEKHGGEITVVSVGGKNQKRTPNSFGYGSR